MSDDEELGRKRLKTESTVDSYSNHIEDQVFKNELILNHIFKNLNAKELKSISRVCKTWYSLADRLSTQYSKSEEVFLVYGLTKYMKSHREQFPKLVQLNDVETYDVLKENLIDSFKRLQTVPSIALFFNSFRSSAQKHYSAFVNNKLLNLLPRTCSIMSVSCSGTGLIGNLANDGTTVETMQDHKFISGISYLFLPDQANCQLIPFKGCQSELCRYLNEEQIVERNIKGVITFIKFNPSASPDLTILREILGKQCNRVALGGIMVEHIDVSSNVDCKTSNSDEPKTMIKGDFSALMFCGENVNCASLIIKETDEEAIRKHLTNFKSNLHFDHNRPNSQLIGFMFACAGRGFNIFDKLNLESDLIKEQFPQLRLYGIFGLGEIGSDFYGPNRPSKIKKDTVLHYYTTVLVLVQIIKST